MSYALIQRVDEGVARLRHSEFGQQIWTTAKIRGRTKQCHACKAALPSGTLVFKPITHGYNRMHRICIPCVDHACP